MVTFIGALLGFLGAMIPELLSFLRDHADRKHELHIMQMQLEQQREGRIERLEAVALEQDTLHMRDIYQTFRSNIGWVDALNGTVRPVMAYAFFLLYATMKLSQVANGETLLSWHY